jgi:hypothetical protein
MGTVPRQESVPNGPRHHHGSYLRSTILKKIYITSILKYPVPLYVLFLSRRSYPVSVGYWT